MGTGRYPEGAGDGLPDNATEETTLADEEWPVAEQYRVQPHAQRPDDGTIVISQQGETDARPVRRFPPDVGPGLLAVLVGVLLAVLLIPAGFWLASRDDDEAGASSEPTPTTETTQPDTTTTTTETAPPGVRIPGVTGRQLTEARAALEEAGLDVRFRRVESNRPRDEVLEQEPASGTRAEPGSVVVLTVSQGQQLVAVPDVVGSSARDATAVLRDAGLRGRTREVTAGAAPGTVVEQSPAAGEDVADGSVVVLDVAAPRSVAVPDVTGARSSEARSRLQALGLRVTQRPAESSRPAGEVVSQSPAAGAEVREGAVVTLRVSTGPILVELPDVTGLDETAATRELEAAGLDVAVVDEPTLEPADDGVVLSQSPRAGRRVRKGSTVTITVGRSG